jgi:protein gp37
MPSAIEWTNETWNPLAGCTPVSAGCKNCYAAKEAIRLAGNPHVQIAAKYAGTAEMRGAGERRRAVFTGRVNLDEAALVKPLRWRKPRRVFVNSMSDLFHEAVPDDFIRKVFGVMSLCGQHTFQVLTKRPERAADFLNSTSLGSCQAWACDLDIASRPIHDTSALNTWPLPHVWLGTSVEDQAAADTRIPHLLRTPAAVRFLSCEPLLGPVDLSRWMPDGRVLARCSGCGTFTSDSRSLSGCKGYCFDGTGKSCDAWPCPTCGRLHYWCGSHVGNGRPNEQPFSWVIAGGESGPGARPMHPDWARSLRDQCQAAGVPFFFKQWGEWGPWWNEDHFTHCGEEKHAHAWLTASGEGGACWIVDDDGSWSNWTGRPPFDEEGECTDPSLVVMGRVGKKAAGRELDGRTWDQFPEVPHA